MYIEQLIEKIITVKQLNIKAPVSLIIVEEESMHLNSFINEIRTAISVLFAFRRKLIKDGIFLEDTSDWLTRLVAVLLRVANYQDHLFLLHHVLR